MKKTVPEQIAVLKERLNAVILAHNYQIGSVQDLADYTGDSLGLSREATDSDAEVIVFCGVRFMAETASILSPGKLVLLPDPLADCPMAQMIDADRLRQLKRRHPDAVVVCYVNTTARVKALSDICCTSSNAVEVVESIDPARPVIFVPDQHLGHFVAEQTGRELILARGYCPTHVRIRPEHIVELRRAYPDAEVMVHPECRAEVIREADVVASTGGMLRHARQSTARVLIVGTEVGLLHRLRRENPGKEFVPATPAAVCPNMKRITPEKVLWALQELKHEVRVPDEVRAPAREALDRMLLVGRESVSTRRGSGTAGGS
ncbi:MAG: quinolinate synthase NadA [Planctomycetota bacterium]|jgi:quinolinate synthase